MGALNSPPFTIGAGPEGVLVAPPTMGVLVDEGVGVDKHGDSVELVRDFEAPGVLEDEDFDPDL
jgi:hypothetical protein